MDLFKFVNHSGIPTILEYSEPINNTSSVMWTERYRDPGEFSIKAPLDSGLRETLPLDSFISHTNTLEVMIVENHQISESKGEEPVLEITGRSLDSYLEQRTVSSVQPGLPTPNPPLWEFIMGENSVWTQVVSMINTYISSVEFEGYEFNDSLIGVRAYTNLPNVEFSTPSRFLKRGPVHPQVIELMATADLGIRTVRPNIFPGSIEWSGTRLEVYLGEDKSSDVRFSWDVGDLDGADYLWSNKKRKTHVAVAGRHVEVMVGDPTVLHYDRRYMQLEATDIDDKYTDPPTGADLTEVRDRMTVRGQQALASQKDVAITRVDISENTRSRYRQDYNLGDIVMVDGNYDAATPMRVIEYVEIEDATGASGHPTLAAIES